ncbi:MAG: metalloregulator ArsR/SmtB family transcription factor [Woeseiaceae bacterium]|nr:metalloregulator ArsR/SmtB family transcription factor [Woeseiaceae bacterium]
MLLRTSTLIQRLKILGDPIRMRLVALCNKGECSVSELTRVIGQSQPRISQQLKALCEAGVLSRFRDGKRVFYCVPRSGDPGKELKQLLALIPHEDPEFAADWNLLQKGRGDRIDDSAQDNQDEFAQRALHRAILDLTVTRPIGDLLDVGCGRGAILKLLASRASRAVGVDIDADARQLARAELMLAGIPNCSLRKGDMYRLPFADAEFNTIVIDDVLENAQKPARVLAEARRLLRPGGRLFVLESVANQPSHQVQEALAIWSREAGLRLAPARFAPQKNPVWLVSVATAAEKRTEAA